jgi:hypothetical protein
MALLLVLLLMRLMMLSCNAAELTEVSRRLRLRVVQQPIGGAVLHVFPAHSRQGPRATPSSDSAWRVWLRAHHVPPPAATAAVVQDTCQAKHSGASCHAQVERQQLGIVIHGG